MGHDRLAAWASHQVVHLSNSPQERLAYTPASAELDELQERLRRSLSAAPTLAHPEIPLSGYAGLSLWNPLDEVRFARVEDVPSFTPLRPLEDFYALTGGFLMHHNTGSWYLAPGLEEWLLGLLVRDGFADLLNEDGAIGS